MSKTTKVSTSKPRPHKTTDDEQDSSAFNTPLFKYQLLKRKEATPPEKGEELEPYYSEEDEAELTQRIRSLQEWMRKRCTPHMKVIVHSEHAELVMGVLGV